MSGDRARPPILGWRDLPGWVFGWALATAVSAVVAKGVLVAFRLADGASQYAARPWLLPALVLEDARLVMALAALLASAAAAAVIAGRRWPAARRALPIGAALLHGALTVWMAVNIPVARLLSTPLTFALLHASDRAITDSIASYASLANVVAPLGVAAAGLVFARHARPRIRPSRRLAAPVAAVVATILVVGPVALRRVDTLGLHRNAAVTLAETAARRWLRSGGGARPPLDSPACRAAGDAPGGDGPRGRGPELGDLAGGARGRAIVWVILESAGARALAAYGAERAVMPGADALAREAGAVIWDTAYAAYPESIKGLYSVLCSREPPAGSEASDYGVGKVPCRSVADELAAAGYRTGLFHSGWFAYLGMRAVVEGRGFHQLRDARTIASPYRSSFGVDDRSTVRELFAWIDAGPRDRPFFAVLMPIAGHHPYRAPGAGPRPFDERSDRDAHANDLHVADDALGALRAGLTARGLDRRVVYVVAGDHGEAFGEHPGNVAHALYLYEENLRVPLFVAAPGALTGPPRRVPGLASLIDLAPTTLALAGLRVPLAYEGRSLLGPQLPPRPVRFATEQGARRAGLRDGRWKLIVDEDTGRAQLFDLDADPGEGQDLSTRVPDRVARMRACLGS